MADHAAAGVDWTPEGEAVVLCLCGWWSDPPVEIGPGWIEALAAALNAHLEVPE